MFKNVSRPEYATTPPIVTVDATDLVTDAIVTITEGKTDIFTKIQTSNFGIASSTEDIVPTTAQTGPATASKDFSEVVLTTGALDTTEATEVNTETVQLGITTDAQKVVTALETDSVEITYVNMTTLVELESSAPTDEITIPLEPEKTSAASYRDN